jgi:hypothetical protein
MPAISQGIARNMTQPVNAESEPAGLEPLLDQLQRSLSATQGALLRSNLAELELQRSRQQALCHQIAGHRTSVGSKKLSESALHTAETCRQAARLQSALLKRLQRGLGLMTLLQSSPAITYEPLRQATRSSKPEGR